MPRVGASDVDFRGRSFVATDAAMGVWLHVLVEEIDRGEPPAPWLREARDHWHLHAHEGFNFGVMAELDRFVTDDARRAVVLSLSRSALDRLVGLGDPIPLDVLNAMGTGGSRENFGGEFPAEAFRKTGRCFVRILDGTLGAGDVDARWHGP